ncbi:MAG TPA: proton-conducting transporter membrane subunit, partial [Anaerolineales bacterium]|nr:proton-conducting transporter membrane subunit [Anaerolineales bacterium]
MPLLIVSAWACLVLLVDLFIPADRKGWTALLAGLGLLGALAALLLADGTWRQAFGGMILQDGYSGFLQGLFLATGLLGILVAHDYLRRTRIERGEYYALLLFTVAGMMLMSLAGDLIVVFVAIELLSVPLYVLSGFARPKPESEESAMKYFLLGAFASGFLVYGIALVFGATATTNMGEVVAALRGGGVDSRLMLAGMALILVGLGFKVAAVPFHMWIPDVYHGAPSAV